MIATRGMGIGWGTPAAFGMGPSAGATLPDMPTVTGYVIVTIDGVRYGLWASRLDP